MTTYGISGIGFNPLGTIGLGMSGKYSSYDAYMPSMMGSGYATAMTNPMFATGAMSGMYGAGMGMGMYDPRYWASAQQQIEQNQVQHAGNMQKLILNNEVNGLYNSNSALINKMISDSDVQYGITRLYEKIKEGDQDGICTQFDRLKEAVLKTYKSELGARGDKISHETSAVKIIEALYGQMATSLAGDGRVHSLVEDIKHYGENAFENGFMNGFKRGHNKRYVDETLNHCFGLEINDQGSKEANRVVCNGLGRAASVLQKGAYGSVAGVTLTGMALGLGKLVSFGKLPWLKCMGGSWKAAMTLGAIAGIVGDIFWQINGFSEK